MEERIGHVRRKGTVPLFLACSILSCAYIPLKCLLYRLYLRVDHIEHIFKCDKLAFLINEFFFVLVREAFKQSTEDEKENGWDRIKALFDVRSVLFVLMKKLQYLLSFWLRGGAGCSIGVFKTEEKT